MGVRKVHGSFHGIGFLYLWQCEKCDTILYSDAQLELLNAEVRRVEEIGASGVTVSDMNQPCTEKLQ
jgi:hypothetical protein